MPRAPHPVRGTQPHRHQAVHALDREEAQDRPHRRRSDRPVRQKRRSVGGVSGLGNYVIMHSMNHGTFPIILQKEAEGGYSVSNPTLEGCYSQGETIEEALQNIKEATLLCLEDETTPMQNKEVSLHLVTV